MLTEYYEDPRALERARTCASGPYLEGFARGLLEAGHTPGTVMKFLRAATHLGLWIERAGGSIRTLDDASIERFRLHLKRCACPGARSPLKRYRRIARHAARFLEHLRAVRAVPAMPLVAAVDAHPLRTGFEAW